MTGNMLWKRKFIVEAAILHNKKLLFVTSNPHQSFIYLAHWPEMGQVCSNTNCYKNRDITLCNNIVVISNERNMIKASTGIMKFSQHFTVCNESIVAYPWPKRTQP